MVSLAETLNGALEKAVGARSYGRNPKRAHCEDHRQTRSNSLVPEVTPCSSGTAPLPRAERFPGEANTLLRALNASLARSLKSYFDLPGRG